MAELLIGEVTHYYSRIGVAAMKLEAPLHENNRIHIVGHTTDLEESVGSMEIEHLRVEAAGPGDDIAVKVSAKVRAGDKVYRQLDGETS